VDTGTKGKGAGESTTTENWEKLPGDIPIETKASDSGTSLVAAMGTLAEPQPVWGGGCKEVDIRGDFI
jgi:hypothetical protein